MKLHLYTDWHGIEQWKKGEKFRASAKKEWSDYLHIDIDLDYYNVEIDEMNRMFFG
jgi:hypothetical protein